MIDNAVTNEEHEKLKTRVHKLADDMQKMMIDHAELTGRVNSAEESIDRLGRSSATSEQVTSLSTVLSLKLDHLLEKQFDMRAKLDRSTRWVGLLFLCGVVALFWAGWHR